MAALTDPHSGSGVSASSQTHVNTSELAATPRKVDVAAPDPQLASSSSTAVPAESSSATARPPPPQLLQNCLLAMETCTQRIVRFNERMETNRKGFQTRATEEPDSLMARRSIVPVVFLILAWVFLVFVWRLCTRLIEQNPQGMVLGTRKEGIAILIPFVVLWLMSMWSYLRVLPTGPGLVKDYIAETEPPRTNSLPYQMSSASEAHPLPIPHHNNLPTHSASVPAPYPSYDPDLEAGSNHASLDSMRVLSGSVGATASTQQAASAPHGPDTIPDPSGGVAGVENPALGGIIGPMGVAGLAAVQGAHEAEQHPHQQPEAPQQWQAQIPPVSATMQSGMWAPPQRRMQNDPPPLSAAALYCHRCRHIKPPRAHHCRRCGTCVLKMDHHCPWVGGCVGSQNQRFFFIFVLWVTLLELYTLITTAVFFHRGVTALGSDGSVWNVDGFLVSLFPITAIFGIFTTALLFTHIFLMAHNMTTIEHMGISRVAGRERVLVDRWFGMQANKPKSSIPGSSIKAKRGMIKEWDRTWGRLTKEANMWWLGGVHDVSSTDPTIAVAAPREKHAQHSQKRSRADWRTNMEQALGTNVLLWVIPFGKAPNLGLEFPLNPRFGPQGVWQERKDWPQEFQ